MPLQEPQPMITVSGPPRKSPLTWLLTLVGFLVVLGVAGGIWWRWYQPVVSPPKEPAPAPPTAQLPAPESYPWAEESPLRSADAYFRRGFSHFKKKQYDLAIADYSKAIGLNPQNATAYNNRGNLFLGMGKYDKVESDIKKALELNPDLRDAIITMAELCSMTRKTEDACKWLKKGIEKGYNNWNYIKTFKTFDNIRNSSCYLEIMKGKEVIEKLDTKV